MQHSKCIAICKCSIYCNLRFVEIYMECCWYRIGDWKLPEFIQAWKTETNLKQLEKLESLLIKRETDESSMDLLSTALQTIAPSEYSKLMKRIKVDPYHSSSISMMSVLADGLSHVAATTAYRSAIESNAKIFYGKTVLDIRGGTGE